MKNNNMTKHENAGKRIYSLLIALILVIGFGLVFYKNMIERREPLAEPEDILLNPKVEKKIIEEVSNGKSKNLTGASKEEESFTFYKTLTDVKKSEIDPVAELLREENEQQKNKQKRRLTAEAIKDKKDSIDTQKPAKKDTDKLKYSVQIASFTDFERADGFLSDLKGKGYRPFIVASEKNSQTHFRIRIGEFESREEADNSSRKINEKENLRSIVVRE